MRRTLVSSLTLICLFTLSCSRATPPSTPRLITVYSTYAAEPWLADVYSCADPYAVISRSDDPTTADIILRVGEPAVLSEYMYQIDEEELLIVTHRESPLQNMTREQAQQLFMGLGDPSVELWIYSQGADVFDVFDQFVMEGRSVAPYAKIAATTQQMSDALNSVPNAVGVLPRHWKAGSVRDVYSIATVPVLVISKSEPKAEINQIIGCLQN